MEKTYKCTLAHQVPATGGGFMTFEAGKEYPDSVIPAVSRDWNGEGPGDPSLSLFAPVVTDKKAPSKGQEVKGDDN